MSILMDRFVPDACSFPRKKLSREVEAILAAKTRYDEDHPDNSMDMSSEELIEVAMASLFEKMCEPPNLDEEPDWEEL